MIERPSKLPDAVARGFLESAALLSAVTVGAYALELNLTATGFLFLIAVLIVASRRPLFVATTAAIGAMVCYNFFFFPPTGTLTISAPANWIALAAFLATSLLANRMLSRERRQAEEARASRAEVEALYHLSVDLLRATNGLAGIGEATLGALSSVGAVGGGLILFGDSPQQQRVVIWTGPIISEEVEELAAGAGRHRRTTEVKSRLGQDVHVPLIIGEAVSGVLVVRGSPATRGALESIATLLAFAMERERFLDERARLELLQESNDLKTSVLQAVSHDLNSPLTVLTLESEALLRKLPGDEHVRVVREQLAQLQHRIGNLLSLARAEAGLMRPTAEPTPAADLFRSLRESVPMIASRRGIQIHVDVDTPDVVVDPSLANEILINLVENAHGAAGDGSDIELHASRSAENGTRVWLDVLDRGTGFPTEQQKAIRRAGPSDADRGGLGIEIARKLATVSGGTVEWFARSEGGTVARLELPAAAPGEIAP